jgi:hypothetical protein
VTVSVRGTPSQNAGTFGKSTVDEIGVTAMVLVPILQLDKAVTV